MSLANVLISALLWFHQRSAMALSPEHRFRRSRKLLATDRSRVGGDITVRPDALAGVPVEWVLPAALAGRAQLPTCVYFHGGAFVMGGLHSHRDMAAILARKAGIQVLMVDYRLAPEHPFPAALDDALAVWRALSDQGRGPLLLAGDSAGGNIALATAQALHAGLRAQGGQAEYLEWARTPHAFPVLARHLPEGRDALDRADGFIRRQLPAGGR